MSATPPETGIAEVLDGLGAPPGEIELTRIPGGASRETWVVVRGEGRWVLRRDPPGSLELASSRELEAAVIEAAAEAGVRVAPVVAVEPEGGRFGPAGFLMEFVDGESIPRRLLKDPSCKGALQSLPGEAAADLARVHSIAPARLPALSDPGSDPALAAVEFWQAALDSAGEPLPVVELGLRWLRRNLPVPVPARLVHGDFRLGNLLVRPDGLAAVLDWELCHLGDPAEDVGWLCVRSWRFGGEGRVAGLGTLRDFLDAYQGAGGASLEPERVRFWEVLGNLKWAVICAQQARRHLSGSEQSLELASLGRRICEPEWDMLDLILAEAA